MTRMKTTARFVELLAWGLLCAGVTGLVVWYATLQAGIVRGVGAAILTVLGFALGALPSRRAS